MRKEGGLHPNVGHELWPSTGGRGVEWRESRREEEGETSYSKPIGGGLDNSAQNWRWATKIQREAGNHVIGRLGPVGMPLFCVVACC